MKPRPFPLSVSLGGAGPLRNRVLPVLTRGAYYTRRSNHAGTSVADDVRNAMRQVPQPVSVVVAKLSDGSYHGATLSSFSSVALHPEPLISFSLRLPSRLADALDTSRDTFKTDSSSMESDVPIASAGESAVERRVQPHFSINILSGNQACQSLAHRFSQAQANHEAALSDKQQWRYVNTTGAKPEEHETTMADEIPIAKNGMASLLCQVVTSIHLSKLLNSPKGLANEEARGAPDLARKQSQSTPAGQEDGSMMFIARVVEVMPGTTTEVLLYKDRKYMSL